MPLSYEEEIEIRRETVLELASKGWTQQAIAAKLGYSQAQIPKDLAVVRSRAREQLTKHYEELPIRYRMILSNLEAIRKEAWQTVANTSDARSKSVLFNTLIAVNREILDVIAAGDLIEQEVANAELITKEVKDDMQRAKEKIAEQAGERGPRTEGFDREDSISTSSSTSQAQEVVSANRAGGVAITVKDSSRDTEEEEGEHHNAENDDTPEVPPSSTTTAATIPSDTMNMATYEEVGDDATVDSTVVNEEREVVADNSSSSYDEGKGTAEEEKQKGDPDS
jgi:hypothetical protein